MPESGVKLAESRWSVLRIANKPVEHEAKFAVAGQGLTTRLLADATAGTAGLSALRPDGRENQGCGERDLI